MQFNKVSSTYSKKIEQLGTTYLKHCCGSPNSCICYWIFIDLFTIFCQIHRTRALRFVVSDFHPHKEVLFLIRPMLFTKVIIFRHNASKSRHHDNAVKWKRARLLWRSCLAYSCSFPEQLNPILKTKAFSHIVDWLNIVVCFTTKGPICDYIYLALVVFRILVQLGYFPK